ncbi:MAG: hypothetical protein ACP5TZ_06435, partial [Nitrososphaeria archaeon]
MNKKKSKGNGIIHVHPSLVFMFTSDQKSIYIEENGANPLSFNQERLNELYNSELHVLGEGFIKAD